MSKAFRPVGCVDELDTALVRTIEETLLFGKLEDLDSLLERIADDIRVPEDLRYGLEGLRYFRAHYGMETSGLSDEDRQRVIRLDAEWTMYLVQLLHRQAFGAVEEKTA